MLFTYKATTTEGRTISGTAEAASKQALLGLLRKQGVHPILIEAGAKKKFELFTPKKKIPLQSLVIFTRQLSTMISAGVPLARSLSALQTDAESPYLSEILSSITKDVESGLPLGDAFERFPNVFNEVFVNMVKAGEEGGILDEILKRLATQVEQDASIRKRIRGAMAYPIVVLSFMVVAFFGIMLFIMPKISGIVTQLGGPHAQLPVYSRVLLGFSKQCTAPTIIHKIPILNAIPLIKVLPNMLFFAAIIAVGCVYLLRYIKTPAGKYKFHGLLLRIPVVKVIVLKIAIARFSRTFASLMGAGVSVLDALDVTGKAIGNKVIEKELQDAAQAVKNGKQLSEPISASKHFPPIVAQMLIVGEETGQVDSVLGKIADFYEEEVGVLIDGIAAVIEPVIIIILGAAVGLIAASVMGPIANLTKQIGSG